MDGKVINIIDDHVTEQFKSGDIVFKITANSIHLGSEKDMGMVTTKKDYEDKILSHGYMPLLYVVDLPLRLAYLYGCLNYSFRQTREIFYTFWWRKLRTTDWNKWFVVNPYEDSMVEEAKSISLVGEPNY